MLVNSVVVEKANWLNWECNWSLKKQPGFRINKELKVSLKTKKIFNVIDFYIMKELLH